MPYMQETARLALANLFAKKMLSAGKQKASRLALANLIICKSREKSRGNSKNQPFFFLTNSLGFAMVSGRQLKLAPSTAFFESQELAAANQ